MKVLADIEWYENEKHETTITQIAAVRISDSYEQMDAFDALVHPDIEVEDSRHIAFNGACIKDYEAALYPEYVLSNFLSWIRDDDLYFWNGSAAALLLYYLPKFPNKIKTLDKRVRAYLSKFISIRGDVYDLAARCGITPTYPKHCAKNDVDVLFRLLMRTQCAIEDFADDADPFLSFHFLSRQQIYEQNRQVSSILGKDILPVKGFRFVYNPKDRLLHRVDCPDLVWTKNLRGFGTLRRAADVYHHGCRCCRELLAQYDQLRYHPSPSDPRPHFPITNETKSISSNEVKK